MGYAPVSNTRDNPPCNTLFIGNLGDAVQEADLHVLFGGQPVSAGSVPAVPAGLQPGCAGLSAVGKGLWWQSRAACPRHRQVVWLEGSRHAELCLPHCPTACVLLYLQGFQQLKVLRSGRQVSCFVEFETVESASQCHTTQQVRRGPTGGWTAGWPAQTPQQGHAVLLAGVAGYHACSF